MSKLGSVHAKQKILWDNGKFGRAVNETYKPKGGEVVKLTTYFNCAYWISDKIADKLKKSTLVEVTGRLFVKPYIGADGNAKASLNCHVSSIKIHAWPKEGTSSEAVAYSLYSLFIKTNKYLKKITGSGFLSVAFYRGYWAEPTDSTAPPLVVYGNRRRWTARHFRATLQAYFLPVSFIGIIGYYSKGLMTAGVYKYFLFSLPAAIPAIFFGRYLNHRFKDNSFYKYVYWGLVTIGVVLVISSVTKK